MKRIVYILFILCCAAPVHAGVLNVVTTTMDLKSITESIGRSHVQVESLGKGNQNYHFVEAKPSLMMKARKADLYIKNGLNLEIGYESLILEGSRNKKIQPGQPGFLDASSGITALEIPEKVDRSMGDIHPSGNPHYWLDPLNAKIIASNIAGRLKELAPEYASEFQVNLERFDQRIEEKLYEWQAKLAPYKGEKICVYHKSWPYFVNRFGLEIACELEPKPGIPPSPSHLKEVLDIIKRENVRVILMEVFYDRKSADHVAGQMGIQVVVVPNSVGGTPQAKDYFALIDQIVDGLAGSFQKGEGHV